MSQHGVNLVLARIKTEQEKEYEKLPFCLYDPLQSRCETPDFPPIPDHCNRCITNTISNCLADTQTSEAMRWFIAYKKLTELVKNPKS